MATSTYKTFLMVGSSSGSGSSATVNYSKLVDIIDFPDLGGSPEQIDVTTLSDKMRHYVNGVQEVDSMKFTANYDKTDYTNVKSHAGTVKPYSVWFGGTETSSGSVTPTGDLGKFDFTADLSVYITGAGVNAARQMAIDLALASDIVFNAN